MDITYDCLNTDELRGKTQADYLVSLDGHLRLIDGDKIVFDEPAFSVVELARSLLIWLGDPDRDDFEFESMSYEEVGSIAVRRGPSGWTAESVFAPGRSAAASVGLRWSSAAVSPSPESRGISSHSVWIPQQ